VDTVQTASWQPADLGRLQCTKDFAFNAYWNGRRYQTKQIRPIFAEEGSEIVVVTIYVYYF
jgi:hypothetical protein